MPVRMEQAEEFKHHDLHIAVSSEPITSTWEEKVLVAILIPHGFGLFHLAFHT
jgi:hypothetical protein